MQFFKAQSCLGKILIAAGVVLVGLFGCCLCATPSSVIAPEQEPTETPPPPTMAVPSPMPTLTKGSQLDMTFTFACPGDYWVIESKNIALMIKPEIPSNKAQFVRNLITLIRPGTKVEIVDRAGFLGLWKRVYLYEAEAIVAEGWISAETVAEAKRVEKGPLCP